MTDFQFTLLDFFGLIFLLPPPLFQEKEDEIGKRIRCGCGALIRTVDYSALPFFFHTHCKLIDHHILTFSFYIDRWIDFNGNRFFFAAFYVSTV